MRRVLGLGVLGTCRMVRYFCGAELPGGPMTYKAPELRLKSKTTRKGSRQPFSTAPHSTFRRVAGGRGQQAVQRQTKFRSLPWCNDLPTMRLSSEQLALIVHLASKRLLVFELEIPSYSSLPWPGSQVGAVIGPGLRSDAVSFHHHDHARLRLSMTPPLCSPGE